MHAVRAPHKRIQKLNMSSTIEESTSESSELNSSGSKPLNETLTDLPLDESGEMDSSTSEGC